MVTLRGYKSDNTSWTMVTPRGYKSNVSQVRLASQYLPGRSHNQWLLAQQCFQNHDHTQGYKPYNFPRSWSLPRGCKTCNILQVK